MKIISDRINGVKVTYIKTNKFKTFAGVMFFKSKIDRSSYVKRMLLLDTLIYSCKKYNTNEKLNQKILETYNASFDVSTSRYGNCLVSAFSFSCINDKYVKENVIDEVVDIAKEILYRPNVHNKEFDKDSFNMAYKNLENHLQTKKERTRTYGMQELYKNMDKDASYSIFPELKELKKIDNKNLYDAYLSLMNDCEVELYLMGDYDYKKVSNELLKGVKSIPCSIDKFSENNINKDKLLEVDEKINTSGSIMYLGLKLIGLSKKERSHIAPIYNVILGAGGSSRCFNIIREKNSLAYYSYSKYDKDDELITIISGIDKKNKEKTKKLTLEVLEGMNKITKEELERVKTEIISSLKESEDFIYGTINLYYLKSFYEEESNDKIIKIIKKVTIDDVLNINKKIVKDTLFFLEGDK